MEIATRLDTLIQSISKTRQPLSSPRLSEFSEIFPCVCPYACASALSREKLKLQKMQDNLVKRSRAVRSCNFQVPVKLKSEGNELKKKMVTLQARRAAVRDAAEQVRKMKCQQDEQQQGLIEQKQVLTDYTSRIDELKEEISRLERNNVEMEGAVSSGILQIHALEKERDSQQSKFESISNEKFPGCQVAKDLALAELERIKEECNAKALEGSRLRTLIGEQVTSIKELEQLLTSERLQLERKQTVIESRKTQLQSIQERISAHPREMAKRVEAVAAREAQIAVMTIRLQRAAAVVKEAEEGALTDDFSLQLDSLRQEENLLIFETSENSRILQTLKEERDLISDENRAPQRLLNFQVN